MTIYPLKRVLFEWDDEKALQNLRKHGVRFEEAAEIFFDPFYREEDASQNFEGRRYGIGYSFSQRLLFIVHTERQNNRIRLISARPATNAERRFYAES
ncbi:BrnT family toxin [Phormidesmis priestleyi]